MIALALAVAAAAQPPRCPPPSTLSRVAPIALRPGTSLPPKLVDWRVALGRGDSLASTDHFPVGGIQTAFHVVRLAGTPGRTRVYALCTAPWGEMLCGYREFSSTGPSPDVFVRAGGGRVLLVVRRREGTAPAYEGWTLDQTTGFRKMCG
jgi:hypothetical protein